MRTSLLTVLGLVGLLAAALAALTVWLVVQEPATVVTVADAVSEGQYEPLLAVLADEIEGLVRALARLL
jgi:HAMP domain-containing protein